MYRTYHLSFLTSALLAATSYAQVNLETHPVSTPSNVGHPPGLRNMHLSGDIPEVLEAGFALFGIQVVSATPLHSDSGPLKIDVDDANLSTAGALLGAMTHCFFVPMTSRLILAVPDNKDNRTKYERLTTEVLVVPNLAAWNTQERSSVEGLLTTVFDVVGPSVNGDRAIVHVFPKTLDQIRDTLSTLFMPEPQVLLEVKTYLISRTHDKNLGMQLPKKIVLFNVYGEAESLISSNNSVVEQLIQAGLVSAGDTLAIAELLIANGYAGNSVLGSSSLYFGGGKTATGVQLDSVKGTASNSVSSVKELQETKLQLADGQTGQLRIGQRYPVLTATTSTITSGSGSSSTPSIQYEDLGLTLEAKLHIMAGREVLVHLHQTIRSLVGTNLNNIPLLNNEEISTDLTIPDGVTTVVVSNLGRTDALAIQGITDSITTDSSRSITESQLLIAITPIVTRGRPSKGSGQL